MRTFHAKLSNFFSAPVFLLIACFAMLYAFTFTSEKDSKTVSVAAEKMNVLYIGVDNPLTVAVEGVPDEKVNLASDEVQLTKTGRGRYNAVAKNPGTASILVHGEGFEARTLTFRVKRIPDPVVTLENPNLYFKTEGVVTVEEFKQTVGLMLNMGGCFDFDSKMEVLEFKVLRVPKTGDPVEVHCKEGKLNAMAKKLIDEATSGDTFYFDMVKVKMEGDAAARKLNSLVFKVK